MHAQRKPTGSVGLLAAALLLGSGCGPIVFSDASALAIEGAAPEAEPPPPEPEKRVEVRDNKIVINEKVQFEFNSAKIMEVSYSLLDEVAKVIKENPQIKKLRVEGHASSEGSDDYNLKLSDKRANSVMKFLIKDGIDAKMLSAKGYGEAQPIASNDTEDGREKNRRVEFTILEQDVTEKKVEVTEDGSENVIEENTVTDKKG